LYHAKLAIFAFAIGVVWIAVSDMNPAPVHTISSLVFNSFLAGGRNRADALVFYLSRPRCDEGEHFDQKNSGLNIAKPDELTFEVCNASGRC
jgi:hypothetical protein